MKRVFSNLSRFFGFGSIDEDLLPPVIPSNDVEREHLHEVCQNLVEFIASSRIKLVEQGQAMYRWLLASLLTLNAGAIVTLASSSLFPTDDAREAMTAFTIGCVFAILTGLSSALGPSLFGGHFQRLLEESLWNIRKGEISTQFRVVAIRFAQLNRRWTIMVMVLGLLSLGSFCVGAAVLL